jgi:DeoR/GlpR family transcriptional regulator of sugar metabolism
VELARALRVAEETIRRDLERLDAEGRLVRIHGGASRVSGERREIPFDVREVVNLEQKQEMARLAIEYVKEGEVIALDASSTVRELARLIPDLPLTVVTNSIAVTTTLLDRPRVRVVSTGGTLDGPSLSYTGTLAEEALERFAINRTFLSCTMFDIDRGAAVATEAHARIKRAMVELAGETILLVDASKFSGRGVEFFAAPDEIDLLITDGGTDRTVRQALKDRGIVIR